MIDVLKLIKDLCIVQANVHSIYYFLKLVLVQIERTSSPHPNIHSKYGNYPAKII